MRYPVTAALLCATVLLAAAPACKGGGRYDRSSPEATLASFFQAVNDGRIPRDLERLVAGDRELGSWKLRCRNVGCESGTVKILARGERSEVRAVLLVDYEVLGTGGGRVIGGTRSPIHFEHENGAWYITQFGDQLSAPPRPAADAAPAGGGPETDEDAGAGTGRDAGAADEADGAERGP